MKCTILVALAAAACASAQMVPNPPIVGFSPQLRQYLDLTQDQLTAIARLNTELQRFRAEKSRRAVQVQLEIRQEAAKQTLDPMALGLRYVELEAIQRELAAQQEKTAADIQKLLTAPQKTKIAALQEALRLYSIACEAIAYNLMTPPPVNPVRPVLTGGEPVPGLIFGLIPQPVCSGTTMAVRAGDFVFTPDAPPNP